MATDLSNWQNFLSGRKVVSTPVVSCVKKTTSKMLSIEDVWKKAKVAKKSNPLDIEWVVKELFGIKLIKKDLGHSASGFLEEINNQWCIYVNKYDNEKRQRFTIAHELGHYILHRNNAFGSRFQHDFIFFRDENTNPIEREANNFAAELLMPKEEVVSLIKEGYNTVNALAEKFDLSTSAVRYRAYKLGLISEY